jgi:hypothetical protein
MRLPKLSGKKKDCPKCNAEIAVEVTMCSCGHPFHPGYGGVDFGRLEEVIDKLFAERRKHAGNGTFN